MSNPKIIDDVTNTVLTVSRAAPPPVVGVKGRFKATLAESK